MNIHVFAESARSRNVYIICSINKSGQHAEQSINPLDICIIYCFASSYKDTFSLRVLCSVPEKNHKMRACKFHGSYLAIFKHCRENMAAHIHRIIGCKYKNSGAVKIIIIFLVKEKCLRANGTSQEGSSGTNKWVQMDSQLYLHWKL